MNLIGTDTKFFYKFFTIIHPNLNIGYTGGCKLKVKSYLIHSFGKPNYQHSPKNLRKGGNHFVVKRTQVLKLCSVGLDGWKGQFKKENNSNSYTSEYGMPYDYMSVMHYSNSSGAISLDVITIETLNKRYQVIFSFNFSNCVLIVTIKILLIVSYANKIQ